MLSGDIDKSISRIIDGKKKGSGARARRGPKTECEQMADAEYHHFSIGGDRVTPNTCSANMP